MKDASQGTYCFGCSFHPCLAKVCSIGRFPEHVRTFIALFECPFLCLWSTKVFWRDVSLLPTRRGARYSCREYRLRSGPWVPPNLLILTYCSGCMFHPPHWLQATIRISPLWPWRIDLQSMDARWSIWNRHFLCPKQAKVSCDMIGRLLLAPKHQMRNRTAPFSYWFWDNRSVHHEGFWENSRRRVWRSSRRSDSKQSRS